MPRSGLVAPDGTHPLTADADGTLAADRVASFEVEVLRPGVVALRDPVTQRYLTAHDEASCAARGLPRYSATWTGEGAWAWEEWTVVAHGRGIALQSCWGTWLSVQEGGDPKGGGRILVDGPKPAEWEELLPTNLAAFGLEGTHPPSGGGVVILLQGNLRQLNRSFADGTGARIVHGCSDFTALAKYHEDRDTYLRNLDITAQWQQYTRFGWRCNGWVFDERGLNVDPYKHSWWEEAFRGVLGAHRDRGLKASVSSFDMNNWTAQQRDDAFRRAAQICSEYGDTVCFSAITNEIAGTWGDGETPENIACGRELMSRWVQIYPGGLQAISDPADRSEAGMRKLAVSMAMIHQFGNPIDLGLRRCFNDLFENYPGFPVDQNEPRGPNGDTGHDVTNSLEDPNEIFALYTMHVLVGCASTYFNGPGAATRAPLDATWGFKELPQLWEMLEMPEDIGQGLLCPGHHDTFMQVRDSHASRADGMRIGPYGLGVISGEHDGQPWKVRADYDATWSVWYADSLQTGRPAWEGRLGAGQVIPTSRGCTPAVVRAIA